MTDQIYVDDNGDRRLANEAELADMERMQQFRAQQQAIEEQKAAAKAALLDKLGITAEEAELLLS
jgi:hypothetical protein